MQADLWGWFHTERHRAFVEGNALKQQMPELYYKGWDSMRAERGDEAVSYFIQGLEVAKKLEDPCWELFFDYWCSEAYLFVVNDYQAALERIVQTAARAHKPQYVQCPVRARVYYTLMHIYYEMDVIGYEDKVREIIHFMETEIPLDDDTEQRIQYKKASLAYELEDYDTAEQDIRRYMDIVVHNAHRQTGGYSLLTGIEYARGNLHNALTNIIKSEENARIAHLERSVISAILRQAIIRHRLGETESAAQLYAQGIAHHERFRLKPMPYHYNVVCEYLELAGKAEEALTFRQESLETVPRLGSPDYTTGTHLQHCRLLGRMGRDVTQALADAREAARLLLKPERYLAKLQKVEDGDFYQYEWQKNHAG